MVLRTTVTGSDDGSSIASHVEICLRSFRTLVGELPDISTEHENKISPGSLNDELGRFRIWAADTEAHAIGYNSLDYRLREASHLRDRIIQLLKELDTVLQEIFDIIMGNRVPDDDLSVSDSDDSMYLSRDEEQETTELSQLVSSIPEITTCLMRLSLSARNPAPHDQFTQSTRITMDHFEAFDVSHVKTKFPSAEDFLVVRLGKAITRRRQYLRYRRKNRRTLNQDSNAAWPEENADTAQFLENSNVIRASHVLASNDAENSPIGSYMTEYYEDILFQTSYLSSSHATRLLPPTVPLEGFDSTPFECPLCFRIITTSNDNEWYEHVFRDIQPYMCTFAECITPDQTYESRDNWFEHEMQSHRTQWECTAGCNMTFRSSDGFRDHFRTTHLDSGRPTGIRDLLRFSKRIHVTNEEVVCKLCEAKLPSLTDLQHHLGDHQCQLSLFALPNNLGYREVFEENGGTENDSHSGREASANEDWPAASHRHIIDELASGFERSIVEIREKAVIEAKEIQKVHDVALTAAKAVALEYEKARIAAMEYEKAKVAAQQELAQLKMLVIKPIKFRDALGRTFSFPWNMCKTWNGMEELIKDVFPIGEVYGHDIRQGHYDLVNSDGDTILPQIWESMVEPGYSITMHMYWPIPTTPTPAGAQTQVAVRQQNQVAVTPQDRMTIQPPRPPAVRFPWPPAPQVSTPPPLSPSFAKMPYRNTEAPGHPPDSKSVVIPPPKKKPEDKKKIPSPSESDIDHSLPSERKSKLKRSFLKWI